MEDSHRPSLPHPQGLCLFKGFSSKGVFWGVQRGSIFAGVSGASSVMKVPRDWGIEEVEAKFLNALILTPLAKETLKG